MYEKTVQLDKEAVNVTLSSYFPQHWTVLPTLCMTHASAAVQQPVPPLQPHCPAIPLVRKHADVKMVLYLMMGTVWIHHSVAVLWIMMSTFR